ncbi:sensor histidine kinase [Microbacterium sp. NPDC055910]|uniref:sensor histidine kinase n=1 Tax=Microbacterium sp. NPDC055910 TaxID=3345659 RepID=UPI0035DCECAD
MGSGGRRATRAVITTAALAAGLTVLAVDSALGATVYAIDAPLAIALAAALGAAIPLAFVRPRLAAALSVAAVLAFAIVSVPPAAAPWPASVAAMVAVALTLGVVGTTAPRVVGAVAWGAGVVGLLVIVAVRDHGDVQTGPIVADLVVFASLGVLALGGGMLLRSAREARRLLAVEREVSAAETARRQLAEERTRIARELHDIVAHGMSAIQVQAASARYRLPDLAPTAADEFDELATTARTAMSEMRQLLNVLREDDPAESAPQPGLRELAELLARPPHGGPLTTRGNLLDGPDDPLTGLTVYRVVQESLSNIARHAPGAETFVRLDRDSAGRIAIEVRNTPTPGIRPPVTDGGGHGLRGMRERVELAGGELAAGPTPEGGFAVIARLPARKDD